MSRSSDDVRRGIGRVQGAVGDTLEAIGDRVAPKKVVARAKETVADKVDEVRDHVDPTRLVKRRSDHLRRRVKDALGSVMGSTPDARSAAVAATSTAAAHTRELSQRAGQATADVVHGAREAPSALRAKAEGNPLAAGLVALGAGMLAASLLPRGEREQQAIDRLKQQLEPVRQQALEAGRSVAGELSQSAQQGVQAVKESAAHAAEEIKGDAYSAVEEVKGTAQSSAAEVKEEVVSASEQVKDDATTATRHIKGQTKVAARSVRGQAEAAKRAPARTARQP